MVALRLLRRRGRVEERRDVETIEKRGLTLALALGLGAAAAPMVLVYVLLVLTSFADQVVTGPDLLSGVVRWTLRNWEAVLSGQLSVVFQGVLTANLYAALLNTLLVALGVSAVVVVASSLAAYAFSRMRFAGRDTLMQFILLLHAFPGVALLIGVYLVYLAGLRALFYGAGGVARTAYVIGYTILARASLEIPMSIWMMKGFFDRIPWEVEWSALIDGASRLRVWREILLPQVKPGLAALAIFSFLAGWEDFVYVYVFMYLGTGGQYNTLATLIEQAVGNIETAELPLVAALGVLYLLPTLLFFLLTQRLLLETYTGGVKG